MAKDSILDVHEIFVSQIKHAMDADRLPFCGADDYYGWDTIDRVVNKSITCPKCLTIIADAALDKLRKLARAAVQETPPPAQEALVEEQVPLLPPVSPPPKPKKEEEEQDPTSKRFELLELD